MCQPKTKPAARSYVRLTAAISLAAAVGGCSEAYFDRRDTVGIGAGDAIAANETAQTVDPWPPYSGNTQLATNGQRMQSAIERYRTNLVTQPVDPMMLQVANQTPATQQTPNSTSTAQPQTIAPGTTTTTTTVVTAPPSPSQ
jgi:hypothetical protein